MGVSDNKEELGSLSDIYDVLRQDAKAIIRDLRGGVVMWREAAASNIAAAGFLLILALTTYQSMVSGAEGTAIIAFEIILAIILLGFAAFGFRKYFQLRRKYSNLFARAKKLE